MPYEFQDSAIVLLFFVFVTASKPIQIVGTLVSAILFPTTAFLLVPVFGFD